MCQRLRVLAILWAAWCLAPFCCGAPLKLAPETTFLVVSPKAERTELEATAMLQEWLRKAARTTTGYEIRLRELGEPGAQRVFLAIGKEFAGDDPRLKGLPEDSFLIARKENVITIGGHTANATYYGAVDFLDRYAGVRFYMPTDWWTSLPLQPEVVFDGPDILSQPFVTSCYVSGLTNLFGDHEWPRRIGAMRRKGGTHQHNLYLIFPPSKFAAIHPEIYPLYNGQRYIPSNPGDQSWQICFTEPATLEAAKESILEHFKQAPQEEYIAVSVNDGGRWSETPRDQEIIAEFQKRDPQGDYKLAATSDIYWRFMDQLGAWMKQALPGKLLLGLAYGPTAKVPGFKLEDNIVVFANLHISELPADGFMASRNGQPPLLTQWLDVTRHFGNHDWYEGTGFLLPRIYSGFWSQFMRRLAEKLPDAYIHCEAYPMWGFDGYKYYVAAKLWWTPSADPRAITRQFCEDMFGPAAAAMNNYFSSAEELWTQLDNVDGPERKLLGWATQFKTTPASQAIIERCRGYLAEAGAAAQTEPQKSRVALFAKCFAFSDAMFALAAAPADESRCAQAENLARQLASDPWNCYRPEDMMAAIQAVSKKPSKPSPPPR